MSACPTCKKPMGRLAKRNLAPAIPEKFGPNRRAALEESQAGWCAICGDLPIPHPRGSHRFTCGRLACREGWAALCRLDRLARLKLDSLSLQGRFP